MNRAVIVSCFDWYEKRLRPIYEFLSEKYDVCILLSDFNHGTKEYVDSKDNCTLLHVPSYKKNISLKRINSHLAFGKSAFGFIEEYKPDLIYALVPPNNILLHCAEYKKKHDKVKFVVDIIDLWPESFPISFLKKNPMISCWQRIRNDNLKYADLVFLECNLYKNELKDYLKNKIVTTNYLYKIQKAEECQHVNKVLGDFRCVTEDDCINLAYVGSINNLIDINEIKKVVSNLIQLGFNVNLEIIGDGSKRNKLLKELKSAGANVGYYGRIYDENRKIEILAGCDFGLNIMKKNVAVGLTIKSIDYFSYGLPLINNIKNDTWDLVEEKQIGINYKGFLTKDEILKYIDVDIHHRIRSFCFEFFSEEAFKSVLEKSFSQIM